MTHDYGRQHAFSLNEGGTTLNPDIYLGHRCIQRTVAILIRCYATREGA